MSQFYCKYCGHKSSSILSMTAGTCPRHPDGAYKGKHALYEGSEKSQYTCKYCGHKSSSILSMTAGTCPRHPDGRYEGRHEPAM